MKTYDVTLSVVYNGHTKVSANSQAEAICKASEFAKRYDKRSIPIGVMPPTVENISCNRLMVESVEEIPEWTTDKEFKVFDKVYKGGGFFRLEKPLTVTVTEDDVKRKIKLMCLVIVSDCGDYIKGITDTYEMWDLLDYLNEKDLCRVYEAVCCD